MNQLRQYAAEILSVLGCVCILRGLALWSPIATWIVGGLMFVTFGVMVAVSDAKEKASHASTE